MRSRLTVVPAGALLMICAILLHGSLLAGIYGKISGRVVDAETGEGLPGVNVVIVGSTQGATTDVDGYYSILQVKPGTHDLRASFVGYTVVTTEGVRVVVDKTTTVDFSLRESVVEGDEVVVTAERPIVQMDRTTTTAVVDGAQLEALPVTNVQDAINLQAGVVDGHFRGGRQAEVAYLLNGVPINNPFTNQRAFDVEQNMVQSLEVISGVFNAEYGQALSGVVNIVTKDVPRKWTGSFLGYVGAIASNRELEFVDRLAPAGSGLSGLDFGRDTVRYSEAADFPNKSDVQVSLGGPLVAGKMGVQLSARYLDDNGYRLGRNLFSPDDVSFGLNTGAPREQWFIESTGDRSFVGLDAIERLSVNGKLNYNISPTTRFDYNVFVQKDEFVRHLHGFKYVPTGINVNESFSQTHILGTSIALGADAFVNASYGYLRDDFKQELYDSSCSDQQISDGSCVLDDRYVPAERNSQQGANGFQVGGNELFTNDNVTESHTLVADYTRQASRVHQVKVGLLARLHRLDNASFGIERSFRTGDQALPSPDQVNRNLLKAKPKEFSVYLQDKMEFTGLIVNAGLRVDYFDPDYTVPIDLTQSDLEEIPDPDNPGQLISNRKDAEVEMQVSPRVGIAFPISSTGVMRFSAGMFFQTPPLSLLYTNPEFEINPQSSSTQFGNANLDPERTLAFEVGLQQGLTGDIGLELTIFSKDVRNLTGQEIFRDPNGDFFVRWMNRDYGTIRGLTFSLFQRPGGLLSWTLDYTLQFAEGTSSDPGEAFGREQSGLEPILSLVRLNWDRRHVLNNTITWSPNADLSATVINQLQTGTPYTTVRDFVRSSETNNADKPTTFTTDVRVYYSPPFISSNVQIFLEAQNLFDAEIQWAVYEDTGDANESVQRELLRRTGTQVGGVNSLDEFFYRQDFYGPPRRVSVGLSLDF